MSDTKLEVRPITRNGVSLTPVVEVVKRGDAAGSPYLVVLPTIENFNSWLVYQGKEAVINMLAAKARQDAQGSLDYVLGEEGWLKRKVTDPESGKLVDQVYYDIESLDINKLYETLTSGIVRSGVTLAELNAEREDLISSLRSYAMEVAKNPTEIGPLMLDIGTKIGDLDAAIKARARVRRTKEEIAADKAAKEEAAKQPA